MVTPNKGQSIFGKIGSNKGISEILSFLTSGMIHTVSNKGLFGQNQTKVVVYDFLMLYLGLINPVYHILGGLKFQWRKYDNGI